MEGEGEKCEKDEEGGAKEEGKKNAEGSAVSPTGEVRSTALASSCFRICVCSPPLPNIPYTSARLFDHSHGFSVRNH